MASPSVVPITHAKLARFDQKRLADQERAKQARFKRSIDRKAVLLDRLEARAIAFDAQLKALKARKEAALVRFEKMEDAVLEQMSAARTQKLTGLERVFVAKPNAPRLVIEDESKIPERYLRQPPIPAKEPDKIGIKAVLARAAGEAATEEEIAAAAAIGGVKLVQSMSLLRR